MPTDRLSAVLRAMVDADVDGSPSLVDRVCVAAVRLLSLRGAGLSLMVNGELRGTAGVSDPGIAVVQELQLTLGEGPCVDAWMKRAPVLEANLVDPAIVRLSGALDERTAPQPVRDAVSALVNLGYGQPQAAAAIAAAA